MKKQENPISYRPSEETKIIFERFCSEENSLFSKGKLIEVAMQLMIKLSGAKLDEVISAMILGKPEKAIDIICHSRQKNQDCPLNNHQQI